MRLPPHLAPIEAVVVPIIKGSDTAAVAQAHQIAGELRGDFRIRVDDRDYTPGWKYSEWEMRGVPVRIEIGPRDIESQSVTLVRRDKNKGAVGAKVSVARSEVAPRLRETLNDIQRSMYAQAKSFLESHTYAVSDRDEFFSLCQSRAGMINIPFCNRPECEANVKERTSATTRVLWELRDAGAACVACGEPATVQAYFAQTY
ncbi:MAG: hypothetical protein JOZ97_08560 [Candidatus Eremiobacteraeota bacterium]|nr:hypothetical protein [Candidatus Eremiobacteraeota bacterium]